MLWHTMQNPEPRIVWHTQAIYLLAPFTACSAQGGFQPEMNKREAALILGLRESAGEERIKEAHRRIMVANHPDSGR